VRQQSWNSGFDSELTIARLFERCAVCGQELPDIELGIFDFCFCGSGILFGAVPQPVEILAAQSGRARV
jgi:hypothetical protein